MKRYKSFIIILLTILAAAPGCESFLDENPETLMTSNQLYASEDGFQLGLNGLYASARKEREGYGYTDSFGATGLYALMNIAGTDNYDCGAGASGEFTAIYKSWNTANVATDKSLKNAFEWLYETVLASNTLIGRIDGITWSSEEKKNNVEAQARLIRAWAYRHLTYMWGDVPLNLVETTGENFRSDWERDNIHVVRTQIIDDLVFASEHLEWTPSIAGAPSKGVALTYLAEMYLAEAEAVRNGSYIPADPELTEAKLNQMAFDAADKCINEGPYSLYQTAGETCAFMNIFTPENASHTNPEALWVMQWEQNVLGGGNNLMRFSLRPKFDSSNAFAKGAILISYYEESRGGRGFARTGITPWALNLYDTSSDRANGIIDDRGGEHAIAQYYILTDLDEITEEAGINAATGEPWKVGDKVYIGITKAADIGKYEASTLNKGFAAVLKQDSGSNNNNWPYTLKYSYCDPGYPKNNESHNDQIYMRLAETVLLRAEASLRLGEAGNSADDINMLRARANALPVTAADITLDFILEERSRELLGEEQRRYTLLRTKSAAEFVEWVTARNPKDKGLAERDYLFPIPQSVIDANVSKKMEQNPGF